MVLRCAKSLSWHSKFSVSAQISKPSRKTVLKLLVDCSKWLQLNMTRPCKVDAAKKKHDWQSEATWLAMLSWPSIRTPRFDTVVEIWIRADSKDNSVAESLSSCCLVPSHNNCTFSAFIRSLLLDIHASTCSIHSTNCWTVVEVDAAGALMYTCMSSAYECPVSPELATTSNSSAT